jgi:hypothetical protein
MWAPTEIIERNHHISTSKDVILESEREREPTVFLIPTGPIFSPRMRFSTGPGHLLPAVPLALLSLSAHKS